MLLLSMALAADPVEGHIDWQAHPAMHQTWPLLFSRGLRDRSPRVGWRHQFTQVLHAPYLKASGVRIFLAAAMAAEKAKNPTQARALILKEFRTVASFVDENSEHYALASSPAEARRLLMETDKMVVVHSIEGGHHLLAGQGDADFWADQGVALITLMHLRDDELGASAMNPKWYGRLVNRAGAKNLRKGERRGLTERGREAIGELGRAGILVDFSHMAPDAVSDGLEVTAMEGIPPVFTHGKLGRITDTEQGITDGQLLEVYRQGGMFSLGLAGHHLDPVGTAAPLDVCPSTLEMFAFHYEAVNQLLAENRESLLADEPNADPATRLAVGWSSDWNGWTHHSRPVHKGCRPRREAELEIDTRGLAHPGLLPQHWERLDRNGVDLEPIHHSAERFLQLWATVRGER